jgi:hypothetical protein
MTSKGYIDFNYDYWCASCGRKVSKGQEKCGSLARTLEYVRVGLMDTLRQVERGSCVLCERKIV